MGRVAVCLLAAGISLNLAWAGLSSGSMAAASAPTPAASTFPDTASTFNVSFHEAGLPAGVNWSVSINDVNKSAPSGTYINFTEPAGSYEAVIGVPSGYTGPSTLNFTGTAGSTVQVMLGFAPLYGLYKVMFHESGLPPRPPAFNHTWSVTLNGSTVSSWPNETLPELGFDMLNGTYPYTVTAWGYDASPSNGVITVAGHPVDVNITFTVNNSVGNPCTNCSGNGPPPVGGVPPPSPTDGNGTSRAGASSVLAFLGSTNARATFAVLMVAAVVSTLLYYRARGPRSGSPSGIYRGFALRSAGQTPPTPSPPQGVAALRTNESGAKTSPDSLEALLR